MRLLVVMDHPSAINPDGDTTLVFMIEALARGHEVAVCEPRHLELDGAQLHATVTRVVRAERTRPPFELGTIERVATKQYDAILMRKDPPFDIDFYNATLLLDRAGTLVVNDPIALRSWNEKLAIFTFPSLIAPTFVTRSVGRLRELLVELGGQMIVKPIDGAGGTGVFLAHKDDRNCGSIFETLTRDGRALVMAQEYLPAAREGDKRILLLDGEPIGAVLRVPRGDDHRGNLHVGGTATKAALSDVDRRICDEVGAACKNAGLWFVGLDVIGGRLTEVNVTSPTGVQEINRLEGHGGKARLEARFIDWLEKKIRRG
jgi:glutathione synthase